MVSDGNNANGQKRRKKEELSATHLPGVHFDQQKNSRHVICIAGQLSSAMAPRGGGRPGCTHESFRQLIGRWEM